MTKTADAIAKMTAPRSQVRDRIPQEVVSAISAVAVIAHKESRHPVQKHIDTINAWLYAAPPVQGIDLGPFREAVQEAYENADGGTLTKFSLEELLALIDQRDAAPGVQP